MARVISNSLLKALRGAIGKEIVFKQYGDETVASKYPDMSRHKATQRQKVQRQLLAEANAYASRIHRDPKLRALYEQGLKPGESVFHKAKKEFFEKRRK
ncbi:hypothetical protein OCK74_09865 [Chitinophagaceae bacterium LB-8]|uniref:Uncharacterized protein n=1 Tax=Paraflavisolibacter caeni TaxID=2982496 RepID=A0A9X2XVL5_9BACT|nr:hypothetical protein [Paraflavisolibacter caeni]MCU7549421.1 hypothetical protein [Paraflavisolibacter caeni]